MWNQVTNVHENLSAEEATTEHETRSACKNQLDRWE